MLKGHGSISFITFSGWYTAMSLGRKIKAARESFGFSQLDLALRCGWESQSRIGNYEQDLREPGLNDLKKLAKALKKPAAYFLEIEEDDVDVETVNDQAEKPVSLTREERVFLTLFKELTKTQRANILGEVRAVYRLNEEIVATYRKRNPED